MAKKIMQFRYYSANDERNQPAAITAKSLTSGDIFSSCLPITQLGIQSYPGVKFYLNGGVEPIMIGSTGIYELDLEGLSEVTSLRFNAQSLLNIGNNNGAYLIVDVVCGEEEEE